jgi:general secretion pathway protein K
MNSTIHARLTGPLPNSNRGIAVITAMLVVAIGTVIAVNLLWDSSLDQRRTAAALATDQGLLYLQGAEAWAADILRQDLVDSPDSDSFADAWALELPPLPIEGGFIAGRLEDLQGRLNLNNLINPDGSENTLVVEHFERLLQLLEVDPSIAGAVVDWLDPDVELRFPTGGEDTTYASNDPPYRTPNGLITSASELMAVVGMDQEGFRRVEPYVTALPQGTTLNVNTSSELVLAALSEDIGTTMAANLVSERADGAFEDIEASFAGLIDEDVFNLIDGVSDHFLLTATVTLGTTQITMTSVLQRDPSGITRAIFRTLGSH